MRAGSHPDSSPVTFVGRAAAKAVRTAGLVVGLVLYLAGAVVTVLRTRSYSHVPFPILYVAPVVGSLVLVLTA